MILALIAGTLAIVGNAEACAAPQDALLSGGSCEAGALAMPDCPSNDEPLALPLKELLTLTVCVVMLLRGSNLPRQVPEKTRAQVRWFHAQLPRKNFAPRDVFLPYLFATHGL